jgi:cephalosporin hydroxylase
MKAENPHAAFKREAEERVLGYGSDQAWQSASASWVRHAFGHRYMYNFFALGRPIIQLPTDMLAVQELIWTIKPDLIIETGIAHGGSLVLSASMLALLDMTDAISDGRQIDPNVSRRKVLGIDIDIRAHNRAAIEAHPMASRIEMMEGSSIAPDVIERVHAFAKGYKRIMVCLDSNHTHTHVLGELNAYASLTSRGSYCIVFDTIVEDLPKDAFPDRPWGPGNNPKTAVQEFLRTHSEFEIDTMIQGKLMITVAPDGYLRRKS